MGKNTRISQIHYCTEVIPWTDETYIFPAFLMRVCFVEKSLSHSIGLPHTGGKESASHQSNGIS